MAKGERRERRSGTGSGLVEAIHEDDDGKRWVVLVPEGETDTDMGIPIGPPDVSALNLPPDIEVKLHNQLCDRRLLRKSDLSGRMREVEAALRAALRVDVHLIAALYSD